MTGVFKHLKKDDLCLLSLLIQGETPTKVYKSFPIHSWLLNRKAVTPFGWFCDKDKVVHKALTLNRRLQNEEKN